MVFIILLITILQSVCVCVSLRKRECNIKQKSRQGFSNKTFDNNTSNGLFPSNEKINLFHITVQLCWENVFMIQASDSHLELGLQAFVECLRKRQKGPMAEQLLPFPHPQASLTFLEGVWLILLYPQAHFQWEIKKGHFNGPSCA